MPEPTPTLISCSEMSRRTGAPISRLRRLIDAGIIACDFVSDKEFLFRPEQEKVVGELLKNAMGPVSRQWLSLPLEERYAFYKANRSAILAEKTERDHPNAVVLRREKK